MKLARLRAPAELCQSKPSVLKNKTFFNNELHYPELAVFPRGAYVGQGGASNMSATGLSIGRVITARNNGSNAQRG